MICNLQSHSGCGINDDQNTKERGAPKIVIYQECEQGDTKFTKCLVAMLCAEDVLTPDARAELLLGRALTKQIHVLEGVCGGLLGGVGR